MGHIERGAAQPSLDVKRGLRGNALVAMTSINLAAKRAISITGDDAFVVVSGKMDVELEADERGSCT